MTVCGRKRIDVCNGELSCTSCNQSERSCSKLLNDAHVKSTLMQMLEKTRLLHNEFGIRAGRLWRTCWRIQRTNAGINANETQSREILEGNLILEVLLVMELLSEQGQ